jgi:hypothetical protein
MTDSTKTWLVAESKSILATALVIALVDGGDVIRQIYMGDWSKATWITLGFILVRSLVKAGIKALWPDVAVGANQ